MSARTARELPHLVRNLYTLAENSDLKGSKKQLEEENSELKVENVRDPLTNAHNRRYFEESLAREFETSLEARLAAAVRLRGPWTSSSRSTTASVTRLATWCC